MRLRQPRVWAAGIGLLLAVGVVLYWAGALTESAIFGALAVTVFAVAGAAGVGVVILSRRQMLQRTAQLEKRLQQIGDDVQSRLRNHADELRAKQSRHEYHQEQSLQRIEEAQHLLTAAHSRAARGNNNPSRVLFVTSNGSGLGHLTRLMAIAERMDVESRFLTLSTGHELVRRRGHTIHHFPSSDTTGLEAPVWNRMFTGFLNEFIAQHRPDLVVFDGTWVYTGVTQVCRRDGIPLVWIQRGCWLPDVDAASPQRHRAVGVCDVVVIPGDYGCEEEVDVGSLVPKHQVGPITLLGREDMVPADQARAELGLAEGPRYVLIQLGAGNLDDTTRPRAEAIRAVRALGPQWQPVVMQSPISVNPVDEPDAVTVSSYPMSRQFAAFEFVVAAAGYNTVNECVGLRVPAVFLPVATRTDDQSRRAHEVAAAGLAEVAATAEDLGPAITRAAGRLAELHTALADVPAPTGGAEAAEVLDEVLAQFGELADAREVAASVVRPDVETDSVG